MEQISVDSRPSIIVNEPSCWRRYCAPIRPLNVSMAQLLCLWHCASYYNRGTNGPPNRFNYEPPARRQLPYQIGLSMSAAAAACIWSNPAGCWRAVRMKGGSNPRENWAVVRRGYCPEETEGCHARQRDPVWRILPLTDHSSVATDRQISPMSPSMTVLLHFTPRPGESIPPLRTQ